MTLHVGRNDPCPCGSGKKFKKCCLARRGATPATPRAAFTAADRESALATLREFASRAEFAEERRISEATFAGECAGDDHRHGGDTRDVEFRGSTETFDIGSPSTSRCGAAVPSPASSSNATATGWPAGSASISNGCATRTSGPIR